MNEKMAALLESVQRTAVRAGGVAADAAYGAGKKANELLSVAKLKVRIMDRRGEVDRALKEAGEILYATHTGAPTDSEILLAKLEEIDALYAEIAELQARIGKEEAGRTCDTCGAAVGGDAAFCGECGEEL